ncbi:hypothetical protein M2404_004104, partial [Rheinheimera pacifica]|uniref:hypothetical protein n=1 Tax=Rheinheimera pacifica TaxID=173990 RepID=UPI00216A11D3
RFQVRACNTLAGSEACSNYRTSTTALAAAKPGVPPGISGVPATSNTGSFTVSWTAASGNVDRYELEQQQNGGAWTQVYSGTALSQLRSMADGSYGYRVRACNVEGSFASCSSYRTSGTVVVAVTPGVPGNISGVPATSGSGSFTVSWTAASGNVDRYELEQQHNGGSWTQVYSGTALSQQRSVADGSYGYRVRACNVEGSFTSCSSYRTSGTVVVELIPAVPAKPTAPAISNNGSYTVSWLSSTHASGYVLEERINSGNWVVAQNNASLSKSYTANAVAIYTYRVSACNGSSCSAPSEIATTQVVYPPAVAPGISSNVSQTTYSYQGNLSVAWNTVATATRYELEQLIGSTWTNKVRANQTSVSLLNYELGSYSFRVRACNAGGCSGWSATRV